MTISVANELVKLSEQHAQGLISAAEFVRARDELLGRRAPAGIRDGRRGREA